MLASNVGSHWQLKEELSLAEGGGHFRGGLGSFYLISRKHEALVSPEAGFERKLTKKHAVNSDEYLERGPGYIIGQLHIFTFTFSNTYAHLLTIFTMPSNCICMILHTLTITRRTWLWVISKVLILNMVAKHGAL